jgi:hypothetical protein
LSVRGFFIVALLRKRYRRFLSTNPNRQAAAARCDREVPVTQAAHEVEGLPWRLLARKTQSVLRHRRLDRRAHLRRGAEEAVRGGKTLHRLVRPLEVVVLNEERGSPLAIIEVGEYGARQELLPHRLPEALDLAAGLRMMRPALHMANAVAAKLLLEPRLAAPGGVLPALVSQDLARRAVVGYGACQSLHHERAPLVVRHHQAHQVARMIIEERRHVDPLVLAQQEGEEIRLPELIRLGALEAPLPRFRLWLHSGSRLCKPFAFQHAAHRSIRGTNAEEALHHIANAPAPGIGMLALRFNHRLTACIGLASFAVTHRPRFGACRAPARALWITALRLAPSARQLLQRRTTAGTVLLRPAHHRAVWNPQPLRYMCGHELLVYDGFGCRHHHVHRPSRARLSARDVFEFRFHSSPPLCGWRR